MKGFISYITEFQTAKHFLRDAIVSHFNSEYKFVENLLNVQRTTSKVDGKVKDETSIPEKKLLSKKNRQLLLCRRSYEKSNEKKKKYLTGSVSASLVFPFLQKAICTISVSKSFFFYV